MKIKPLSDRVVVRRNAAQEKTAGGLLLPDAAKNKSYRGEILAVGPGRMLKDGTRKSLQVKVGDKVLFTNWAGEEYRGKDSGDNVLLMREEDILAVLD